MQTLNWIDWLVLGITLIAIVSYGTWQTRGSKNVKDYLRGGNTSKWWTIGLSVMATQASAITFLSTPGQAFNDGMGFVQFYFGLPIAMIVICMVFIPLYHRLKVYTAYEFLENRFDLKTRTLAAILFLIQRGLAAGITIFAPAIILSVVLGWDLLTLNIVIGCLVIIYTVSGGTRAVNVTQKHQMVVIFIGMLIAFLLIVDKLPEDITFSKALDIAGASGKMEVLDFSFNLNNRYTFWSGIIGGTFLMLSYFGTDQSQVQRYLSGKSVKEMQLGLVFNGLLKIPMQFFILLVGVMVFVFYQFNEAPVNFNPTATELVLNSEYADDFKALQAEQKQIFRDKQKIIEAYTASDNPETVKYIAAANAANDELRKEARDLIDKVSDSQDIKVESNDKDYVFIHFILNNLPRGLIGLLLAVILSAAMSSTASELNALGSTTTIDLYIRNTGEKTEEEKVKASRWFTFLWGVIAIGVACIANLAENLIQLVNIIGSIFYGNVLGIFLLAFFFKFVKGNAVFIGALITQVLVIALYLLDLYEYINLPFLWLNFIGCMIVMAIACIIQFITPKTKINA
ncbi:sodium:solute symporter [Algibacter amylolyticus]|uniref:Sodium:solute symporter n=1 Tax=Algibacter amylolyticus TaxID=1608400 RepID=A0A5M7B7Q9_9FLAO|nr:sodium:solute symporter [Algibacter amylolyticus]KAA5823435.1 sodium:solute symporter [Algibacter amylolyticus]MBB5267584.1 Na+/proline symporter [Algibacter amylolyticus]TSJ73923.1 sodium:solute symporter [Algibacter amylolyticus]